MADDFNIDDFFMPAEELAELLGRSGDGEFSHHRMVSFPTTRTPSSISLLSLINKEGREEPFVLLPEAVWPLFKAHHRLLFVLMFLARHWGPDIQVSKRLLNVAGIDYPRFRSTYRSALASLESSRAIRIGKRTGGFPILHLNLDAKKRLRPWLAEDDFPDDEGSSRFVVV